MNKIKGVRKNSVGKGMIIATALLPVGIYFVISLIFTAICYAGNDPTNAIDIFSLVALLLSGALSSFINARLGAKRGFPIAVIATAFSSALLLILGLVFSAGAIGFGLFMNIICYVMVCLLFGFFGKSSTARKHSRRR